MNSTFQQRHYVKIAAAIADMPDFAPTLCAQKESVTNTFADMLARDNPRFNRERFIAAAQGNPLNGRDKHGS